MKKIRTRILSITIALLILSLAVVTSAFAYASLVNSRRTVEKILSETTNSAANAVENELKSLKNILQEIGTIARLSNVDVSAADKTKIFASKVEKYGFIEMSVLDARGMALDGRDMSGETFFQRSIKGENFISTPEVTEDGSGTTMIISAPLWKDGLFNTEIVGVVYGITDGEMLSEIAKGIKVGETGAAYIVDSSGRTIADVDYTLVLSQENTQIDVLKDPSLQRMATMDMQAIGGQAAFGEIMYDGLEMFLGVAPINGSDGWAMGVTVEMDEFMSATYSTVLLCVGISALFLIIGILIILRFSNKLTRPIVAMAQVMGEISQGNYDVEVTYVSKDEIGVMADSARGMLASSKQVIEDSVAVLDRISRGDFTVQTSADYIGVFARMESAIRVIVASLSQTLGDIKVAAQQVASGSAQVSDGAQALSQGATEQAAAIQELSAAISEISNNIKQNADNAFSAQKLSDEAGADISVSSRHMQEMVDAMNDIAAASDEIGKIIKTIDDIAFQTNILALNAAVEAAHAGEAGKGFAVVADEVRNLAQKSAEAARNTTSLIERAVGAVGRGTTIVDTTADSLRLAVAKVEEITRKVGEITAASAQQADAIMQVTTGVDQISAVVQTNSATAEQSAAASQELSSQAQMLNDLCERFVLAENAAAFDRLS